jgi:serine/threonine protein kinase
MNASEPANAASAADAASSERLRELMARFQATWAEHREDPQAVDLGAYLPAQGDSLRPEALLRLIPIDLEGRWQNGVPVSLEDYLQRFPEIGPIEAVAPRLIADEYRIRARFGVISPHSVLRQRFPRQFTDVEKLIQSDPGHLLVKTVAPIDSFMSLRPSGVMLLPNQIVGDHYQLNKQIGRGGFGEVWHATDLRGGIDKAIKSLTRSADSEDAQKELESLNMVKRINHPCVLRTESYFVERDRLFIVLELADATLRDVLKKSQTESRTGIPTNTLLAHLKHAAEGLDFLHRQGIVHRDIKPENILIVGDYGKVADFGLAKAARNKQSTHADFAGTVVYSAPETWDGRITTRSDQYSLAATYFEMRTGRVLFGGKTFQEIFRKHMDSNPDFEPLPELEQNVLRQALAKKPEDRYPTCSAFVHALEQAVLASGSKVVASDPPMPPSATRKNNAETTLEADSAVSRVNAGLRAAAVLGSTPQTAPKKWNDAPARRPSRTKQRSRTPLVVTMVGCFLVAGVAAYAYHEFFVPHGTPHVGTPTGSAAIDKPKDLSPPLIPTPTLKIDAVTPSPPPKKDDPKPIKIAPPPDPVRVKLGEARKQLSAKEFAASKATIDGLKVTGLEDAELKRDGLALYAELLRQANFTREELREFDAKIMDDPDVKPAFMEAMTNQLIKALAEFPDAKEGWDERIRDCERADSSNRVVQAIKAEAVLQTGGDVAKLPSTDEEPAFMTFVRARLAAREKNHVAAAKAIASLPANEAWLTGKRAKLAAAILQEGAVELTPDTKGRLLLFDSLADADRAAVWQKQALQLWGNPTLDDQNSFPWKWRLNIAVAAACNSKPEYARCQSIGKSLLENPDAKTAAIELALAYPAGFPNEFKKVQSRLTAGDLESILRVGAEQLQASAENANNAELRGRQALLSYTKARALSRDGNPDIAAMVAADKVAFDLEPKKPPYLVAVGRNAALMALEAANRKGDGAERIKECERGLEESKAASAADATEDKLWPDLGRARALLFLTIGRNSDFENAAGKEAAKTAFENAISAARAALENSPSRPETVIVVAQAHEGLANLCGIDINKNFEDAIRSYGQAVAAGPRFALQRGRCLYRWATHPDLKFDKATRDVKFRDAIEDLEKLAQVEDVAVVAEGGYWEALAHWDRLNRISAPAKAQKAFERSLKAAANDPAAGGAWAPLALRGLVEMTRIQAKNAPGTSSDWLFAVLPDMQKLAKHEPLAAHADFAEVSSDYRDLLAETSADHADRILKFKNVAKYPEYIDRALTAKHSTKHANYAVDRAVNFKKHAAALRLTPQAIATAREDALAAIKTANPIFQDALRKQLDAGSPP